MTVDFGLRYDMKRISGISEIRSDGSKTSRQTDVQAGAAEQYAADFFKVKCNTEVYPNHGDGGKDFCLRGMTVDVVHLGMICDNCGKIEEKCRCGQYTSVPRMRGNLLVNPHEPQRHAQIYMLVRGSIETKFEIVGWYTHNDLIARPQRNFGHGNRFNCPDKELCPIDLIVDALSDT